MNSIFGIKEDRNFLAAYLNFKIQEFMLDVAPKIKFSKRSDDPNFLPVENDVSINERGNPLLFVHLNMVDPGNFDDNLLNRIASSVDASMKKLGIFLEDDFNSFNAQTELENELSKIFSHSFLLFLDPQSPAYGQGFYEPEIEEERANIIFYGHPVQLIQKIEDNDPEGYRTIARKFRRKFDLNSEDFSPEN